MKKRFLCIFLIITVLASAFNFQSCTKISKGKDGFFGAVSSLDLLLTSVMGGYYSEQVKECFLNNTVQFSLTATAVQKDLDDEIFAEFTSLFNSAQKQSQHSLALNYADQPLKFDLYGNDKKFYLGSDALNKYADVTNYFSLGDTERYINAVFFSQLLKNIEDSVSDEHFSNSLDSVTVDDAERDLNMITLSLSKEEVSALISDDRPVASLKYSRGIHNGVVYLEQLEYGDVKLFYIFSDGDKDNAVLQITLGEKKVLDIEYSLEGHKDFPTRRIIARSVNGEFKLTAETVSSTNTNSEYRVTLDIIGNHTTSFIGDVNLEKTSFTEYKLALSGKLHADTLYLDISGNAYLNLNSANAPTLPQNFDTYTSQKDAFKALKDNLDEKYPLYSTLTE